MTRVESIAAAIETSGPIDVLVNNAGIGVIGVFEATPMATVREVFETNTFGAMAMAMTQALLPQFRTRRSGVVVNVTSSVTLAPMPLAAAYTASKMAIEGFTGSLAHELAPFNVNVKLVEPGYAPTTRFTSNGTSRMEGLFPETYADFAKPILDSFAQMTTVTRESDVAEAVYRAANDASGQVRFPAKFSFKATPAERTYGEQILHVAGGNVALFKMIGSKAPAPTIAQTAAAKADVLKALGDSYDFGIAALKEQSDQSLLQRVDGPRFLGPSSRARIVNFAIAHAQDIYGQMVVYLRLNGIVPPASRSSV